MAVQGVFPVLAKIEAYLVSVRLSLLCLTEVAFFSQLKAKPSISKKITTRFTAVPPALLPALLLPLLVEMTLNEDLSSF